MMPACGCNAAWAGIHRCRGRSIVPGLAIISSRLGHLRPGLTHYTQQRVRCAPFTYALRDRLERVDRLLDRNLAVQRRAPHGAVRSVALQRRRVLLPRTERHEIKRGETKPLGDRNCTELQRPLDSFHCWSARRRPQRSERRRCAAAARWPDRSNPCGSLSSPHGGSCQRARRRTGACTVCARARVLFG